MKTIWLTNTPPSGYSSAGGKINYVSNEQYTELRNKIIYQFLSSLFEVDGIYYVPISPSERTCDVIDCVYSKAAKDMKIGPTIDYMGINMTIKNVQPYFAYNNTEIERLELYNNGDVSNHAFNGCSALRYVLMSDSVKSLGISSYQDCSKIENVKIGNGIITIGDAAFSSCVSLPSITIPARVVKIGDNVFDYCNSLKQVIISDRDEELTLGSSNYSPLFASCPLDTVYIGGNISYKTTSNFGYSPFYRNKTLRTVHITNKETEISANEFYGCTNLQDFYVGDGVLSFGDWAFSGCSSLKSLSFGSKLRTIGKEAFSDCSAVTNIVSKAATPPTCDTQALDDINKWTCTLYVPKGTKSSYQMAEQWKEFFFIEEGTGTAVNPIMVNPAIEERYTLNGQRISQPRKGINIVKMSNGSTRKVIVK